MSIRARPSFKGVVESIVKRVWWAHRPVRSAPKCQGSDEEQSPGDGAVGGAVASAEKRRPRAGRSVAVGGSGKCTPTKGTGGGTLCPRSFRSRGYRSIGALSCCFSIDRGAGPSMPAETMSKPDLLLATTRQLRASAPSLVPCWRRPHHPALVLFSDAVVKIQRAGGLWFWAASRLFFCSKGKSAVPQIFGPRTTGGPSACVAGLVVVVIVREQGGRRTQARKQPEQVGA